MVFRMLSHLLFLVRPTQLLYIIFVCAAGLHLLVLGLQFLLLYS